MRRLLLSAALAGAAFAGAAWAGPVSAPPLSLPDGAALYSLGSRTGLAVLESLNRRVLVAGADGARVGDFSTLQGPEAPQALASDETGLLLVVDRAARGHQVRRYRNGALEGRPVDVSLDPKRQVVGAAARNGILWLVLRRPAGVLLLAYDGQVLAEPTPPSEVAVAPFSIALSAEGRAYVTDPMGPSVLVYSPSGTFEARRDLRNTGFTRPTGVAVDATGAVHVSDGVTGRVGRLEPEGAVPAITPGGARFEDPLRLFADPRGQQAGYWVLEGKSGKLHAEGR